MHFLLARVVPDPPAFDKVRNPTPTSFLLRASNAWPVFDRASAREFRNLATKALDALKKDAHAFPAALLIRRSLFDDCKGDRFVHLMLALATHAVKVCLERDCAAAAPAADDDDDDDDDRLPSNNCHPSDPECPERDFFRQVEARDRDEAEWTEYGAFLSAEFQKSLVELAELTDMKAQLLRSPIRVDNESYTLFHEVKEVHDQKLQTVESLWSECIDWINKHEKNRDLVSAILEQRITSSTIDASDAKIQIPADMSDVFQKDMKQMHLTPYVSGGQLDLVSVVQLWDISVKHIQIALTNEANILQNPSVLHETYDKVCHNIEILKGIWSGTKDLHADLSKTRDFLIRAVQELKAERRERETTQPTAAVPKTIKEAAATSGKPGLSLGPQTPKLDIRARVGNLSSQKTARQFRRQLLQEAETPEATASIRAAVRAKLPAKSKASPQRLSPTRGQQSDDNRDEDDDSEDAEMLGTPVKTMVASNRVSSSSLKQDTKGKKGNLEKKSVKPPTEPAPHASSSKKRNHNTGENRVSSSQSSPLKRPAPKTRASINKRPAQNSSKSSVDRTVDQIVGSIVHQTTATPTSERKTVRFDDFQRVHHSSGRAGFQPRAEIMRTPLKQSAVRTPGKQTTQQSSSNRATPHPVLKSSMKQPRPQSTTVQEIDDGSSETTGPISHPQFDHLISDLPTNEGIGQHDTWLETFDTDGLDDLNDEDAPDFLASAALDELDVSTNMNENGLELRENDEDNLASGVWQEPVRPTESDMCIAPPEISGASPLNSLPSAALASADQIDACYVLECNDLNDEGEIPFLDASIACPVDEMSFAGAPMSSPLYADGGFGDANSWILNEEFTGFAAAANTNDCVVFADSPLVVDEPNPEPIDSADNDVADMFENAIASIHLSDASAGDDAAALQSSERNCLLSDSLIDCDAVRRQIAAAVEPNAVPWIDKSVDSRNEHPASADDGGVQDDIRRAKGNVRHPLPGSAAASGHEDGKEAQDSIIVQPDSKSEATISFAQFKQNDDDEDSRVMRSHLQHCPQPSMSLHVDSGVADGPDDLSDGMPGHDVLSIASVADETDGNTDAPPNGADGHAAPHAEILPSHAEMLPSPSPLLPPPNIDDRANSAGAGGFLDGFLAWDRAHNVTDGIDTCEYLDDSAEYAACRFTWIAHDFSVSSAGGDDADTDASIAKHGENGAVPNTMAAADSDANDCTDGQEDSHFEGEEEIDEEDGDDDDEEEEEETDL
ncbi:HAUS augmin-like complex subunit 6 [Entophlyctis sp. JEL0112]|nr:HAUS augmin-like complex subunit 6 [Entophlyctis sp. JEL0112]